MNFTKKQNYICLIIFFGLCNYTLAMEIIDPLNSNRLNDIFKTADIEGLNTFLGEDTLKTINPAELETKFKNTKPWWYFDTLGATGENQMNFIYAHARWGSFGLFVALAAAAKISKPENDLLFGMSCIPLTVCLLSFPAIPVLKKMQDMHGKRSDISERIKTHHSV